MREIVRRLCTGAPLTGVPGTAVPLKSGGAQRFHGTALDYEALRDSIALTPYDAMPYERYWQRLEEANRIDALPYKAEREARLAEIRSVRLITLNYCPMACTFCSSTNFLHSAQGSVAKIARLTAEDCMRMIEKIVEAQPLVRSIIFQDDIFVFTNDKRIEDLCQRITRAKTAGHIPRHLEFISTNRIDAMTDDRLRAMRGAGFRVVGFGVESFSKSVLEEFNKGQIHRHIAPALRTALKLGLTPFLDLILCSPRSSLQDIVDTVSGAFSWITAGCEVGLYPYVVPFSGAQMSRDPELAPFIVSKEQTIPGTEISWSQPEHIMPIDAGVRRVLKEIVTCYGALLTQLSNSTAHIPSRVRSLLWVASALPVLRKAGAEVPDAGLMIRKLRRECGLNELREVA